MKLRVLVHPADEGGFWAEIPALPGCVSEGETFAETLANIREAAQGWLEVAAEQAIAGVKTQAQKTMLQASDIECCKTLNKDVLAAREERIKEDQAEFTAFNSAKERIRDQTK